MTVYNLTKFILASDERVTPQSLVKIVLVHFDALHNAETKIVYDGTIETMLLTMPTNAEIYKAVPRFDENSPAFDFYIDTGRQR